jgi:hypothetical protein
MTKGKNMTNNVLIVINHNLYIYKKRNNKIDIEYVLVLSSSIKMMADACVSFYNISNSKFILKKLSNQIFFLIIIRFRFILSRIF